MGNQLKTKEKTGHSNMISSSVVSTTSDKTQIAKMKEDAKASNDWMKMAVEKMRDQGKANKMLKVEVESLLVSKARAADVASLASSKRDSGTKSSDGGDFGALLRLKGEASESRRRLLEAKKISEESEEKVIELENKFKKKERENNDALGHLE